MRIILRLFMMAMMASQRLKGRPLVVLVMATLLAMSLGMLDFFSAGPPSASPDELIQFMNNVVTECNRQQ